MCFGSVNMRCVFSINFGVMCFGSFFNCCMFSISLGVLCVPSQPKCSLSSFVHCVFSINFCFLSVFYCRAVCVLYHLNVCLSPSAYVSCVFSLSV